MKKILSILIILCLSFTLISCGQKKFDFNEEDDESGPNFLGSTFSIYTSAWLFSEDRKRGESASADRFLDRLEEIEKQYNVKMSSNYCDIEQQILAKTVSGGGNVDMIFCMNDTLYSFYELGILTPFEEIGVKDHEDIKFGIPALLLEGTFDKTRYGILNYLGDSVPSVSGLIGINMNLIDKLAMTDPHEYVEKGEWDWQNYKVVLQQGTFNDGEINHVGMLIDWLVAGIQTFLPAIISNGGYIIKEIDGVYKSGLTNSNTIEAIEFMTDLVNSGLVQISGGSTWDEWEKGEIWPLHFNGGASNSQDIEYSLVKFPCGPNGDPDIVAGYSLYRYYYAFTILSSFENEEIGIIVDDLFDPLDASLYPEGWKDYAVENLFYSDEDFEVYLSALDTMDFYPLALLYGTNPWNHGGEIEAAISDIAYGRGTAQSKIDSVKDALNQVINEKLNK